MLRASQLNGKLRNYVLKNLSNIPQTSEPKLRKKVNKEVSRSKFVFEIKQIEICINAKSLVGGWHRLDEPSDVGKMYKCHAGIATLAV